MIRNISDVVHRTVSPHNQNSGEENNTVAENILVNNIAGVSNSDTHPYRAHRPSAETGPGSVPKNLSELQANPHDVSDVNWKEQGAVLHRMTLTAVPVQKLPGMKKAVSNLVQYVAQLMTANMPAEHDASVLKLMNMAQRANSTPFREAQSEASSRPVPNLASLGTCENEASKPGSNQHVQPEYPPQDMTSSALDGKGKYMTIAMPAAMVMANGVHNRGPGRGLVIPVMIVGGIATFSALAIGAGKWLTGSRSKPEGKTELLRDERGRVVSDEDVSEASPIALPLVNSITNEVILYGMYDRKICTVSLEVDKGELTVDLNSKNPNTEYNEKLYAIVTIRDKNGVQKSSLLIYGNKNKLSNKKYMLDPGSTIEIYHSEPNRRKMCNGIINDSRLVNVFKVTNEGLQETEETPQMKFYRTQAYEKHLFRGQAVTISDEQKAEALTWWLNYKWHEANIKSEGISGSLEEGATYSSGTSYLICINGLLWGLFYDYKRDDFTIENIRKERIKITYDKNTTPVLDDDAGISEYLSFLNEEANKKVLSSITETNDKRETLLNQIERKRNELKKINSRSFTPKYTGIDPVIVSINQADRNKFLKRKKSDMENVKRTIENIQNDLTTCENKMIDILHPALNWYLKNEMEKQQFHIKSIKKPTEGTITSERYIYLSGFPWLLSREYYPGVYDISSGSDTIKIRKIGGEYIIDHKDPGFKLYLNELNRMKSEHKENLNVIDSLRKYNIATYFGRDWCGEFDKSIFADDYLIHFDIRKIINDVSDEEPYVQSELSKLFVQFIHSDSKTPEKYEFQLEQFVSSIQLLHQYASSKNTSDNSRLAASNLLLKLRRLVKDLKFSSLLENYLTAIDAEREGVSGDRLYYEAIDSFLFDSPDGVTNEMQYLQSQERFLMKIIAQKENDKVENNEVLKIDLSMNSRTKERLKKEAAKKNEEIQSQIDNLNVLLIDVRLNIKRLNNDNVSSLLHSDMLYFMKKLYRKRIDDDAMQDFTQKILKSEKLSLRGMDAEAAILRNKARYILELVAQSKSYDRLCGLFTENDIKKEIVRANNYRDIESAITNADEFSKGLKGANNGDIIHLQAIYYYIIKHGINAKSELLNVNPQHFYYEYVTDMVGLYPIKVGKRQPGYFSRLVFFHRNQFESQFDYNEQFKEYKNKYANYEASVIARTLFNLIPAAPLVSDLYNKPQWVKKFECIRNRNDCIYTMSLDNRRALVVSYINNMYSAKIHQEKDLPSFFLNDPLAILGKNNYKIGLPGPDVNVDTILTTDEINSFQAEIHNFMTIHQQIEFNDSVKINGIEFYIHDKNTADCLVSVVEDTILSFTDTQKLSLDETGIMHHLATMVIPFYDVIYTNVNDSEHDWDFKDTLSIMSDVVSLLFACAGLGVKINSYIAKEVTAAAVGEYAIERSRNIRLVNIAKKTNILTNTKEIAKIVAFDATDFILNPLPLSPRNVFSFSRVEYLGGGAMQQKTPIHTKYAVVDISGDSVDFISMRPMESQRKNGNDIFEGVFTNDADGNFYISTHTHWYQVRWSDIENTWRIVDPAESGIYHWTPAVKFNNDHGWSMNFAVDLKGGWWPFNDGGSSVIETSKELRNLSELTKFKNLSERDKITESIKLKKSKDSQYEYFFDLSGDKKRLNIVGHGNRHDMLFKGELNGAEIHSPQELSTLILPLINDNSILEIRLISCWAGKTGYAQQLANYLNVPVKAPMGKVATLEVMPGRYWFLEKPANAAYPDMHEWRVFNP